MKRITIKNSDDKQRACTAINMLGETEQHEVFIDAPLLKIGPYTLQPFPRHKDGDDPSYWIEHESGEGMQVWHDQMLETIEEIWKEF